MKAINWICGFVSVALLVAFLGKYAVSINAIPLWIIILGCLVPPIVDVIQSARAGDATKRDRQEVSSN